MHSIGVYYWGLAAAGDDPSAFVRVIEEPLETIVFLANASRTGFERVCAPLSGAMLDSCVQALRDSSGLERHERVSRCFQIAARVLSDAGSAESDEHAAGSLLTTWVTGNSIHAAWIGPDEAWLVADGDVVQRTRGHVRVGQYLPEGGIVTRALGDDYGPPVPEQLDVPWDPAHQQRLLVLSRALIGQEDSIRAVLQGPTYPNHQEAAKSLVEAGVDVTKAVYAVAVAVDGGSRSGDLGGASPKSDDGRQL
jgi:hypothetical protein